MTQLLPVLSAAKEAALRDSIREHGVLVPIVRSSGPCRLGDLIDGHHRLRIATDEGKPCPEAPPIEVRDEEHFAQLVLEINDNRRQALTREQRQKVVASLREKGHSHRAIAEAVGVGKATVTRDLEETKATGPVGPVAPPRITGLDGKSRPATRAPRGGKPSKSQLQKEAERKEEEEIRQHVEGRGGAAVAPPLPPRKMRELRDRLHQRIVDCLGVIGEAQRAELDLGFAEFGTAERLRKLGNQAYGLARKVEQIPSGNQENDGINRIHSADARDEAPAL